MGSPLTLFLSPSLETEVNAGDQFNHLVQCGGCVMRNQYIFDVVGQPMEERISEGRAVPLASAGSSAKIYGVISHSSPTLFQSNQPPSCISATGLQTKHLAKLCSKPVEGNTGWSSSLPLSCPPQPSSACQVVVNECKLCSLSDEGAGLQSEQKRAVGATVVALRGSHQGLSAIHEQQRGGVGSGAEAGEAKGGAAPVA